LLGTPLACPLSALSGCEQSQQKAPLLDHLVGAGEHSRRDIEAKRLGRFEVYDQFELGRLLDWKISGFRALENLIHVLGGTLFYSNWVGPVRNKAA